VAAALAPVAVIAAGAALAGRRRGRFLVAALPALTVLVGVAAGTQAHMFAARYVIPAVPFIALGIGWAVAGALPDRRRDQRRWDGRLRGGLRPTGRPRRTAGRLAGSLLAVSFAVVAFLPVVAPLRTEVYARALEVTDPYDPTADWQALHDAASHRDIAVFNILSLAGFYERYRTPSDPAWTYAQLWDPVHEPLNRARQRVSLAARRADRIWLVLYKGTYAEDSAALKAWADETFYPADSNWSEDRLYQSYIDAVPDQGSSPNASFGHGVRLEDTTFTTSSLPGHGVALQLQWHASRTPDADGKVFVHLYAPNGTLVAQHDGFPAFDTRPPTTWRAGEDVRDRIGLYVPPGTQGPLRLAVGIYDPSTGARWKLPNGADHVDVGEVNPAP
jgi:hypothetical protein